MTIHTSQTELDKWNKRAEDGIERPASWKESDHHKSMRLRAEQASVEVDTDPYQRYFDLMDDYKQKQLIACIQNGTRFNLGMDVPWVKREKIPFPKGFTCFYFIQRGALFAECSGQIAFVEFIEIPKGKSKTVQSAVFALQNGLHSIGNIRRLLGEVFA